MVYRPFIVQLQQVLSADFWQSVEWKNRKALPHEAYNPTTIEHLANVITHGIWIIPSIFASFELFQRSHTNTQVLSALIYGATLTFLFSVSTSFHCSFLCTRRGKVKDILHRCDRAMIYIFIAGSYFPWLSLEPLPHDGWSPSMKWIVWVLAILGVIYQQTFHEKYKSVETCLYLIMAIGPGLMLVSEHEFSGMAELKLGGVIYVIGVMFFKSDGVIPCAHAIWHLFVAMAAATHYFAILNCLYPV